MTHLLVTYLPGKENVPGFPHELKRIDGYALDTVARFATEREVADYLREHPGLTFAKTQSPDSKGGV